MRFCLILLLFLGFAHAWQAKELHLAEATRTHSALTHWQVKDQGWLLLEQEQQSLWVKGPALLRVEGQHIRPLQGKFQWHAGKGKQLLLVHARLEAQSQALIRINTNTQGHSSVWLHQGEAELIYGPRSTLHFIQSRQGLEFSLSLPPHSEATALALLSTPQGQFSHQALTPSSISDPVRVIGQQDLKGPERPTLSLRANAWSQYSGQQQQHHYLAPWVEQNQAPGLLNHLDLELYSWHWVSNQAAWQWRITQDWQYGQQWHGQGIGFGLGWHYRQSSEHQWWLMGRTMGLNGFRDGLEFAYQWQGEFNDLIHDIGAQLSLHTNWQRDLGIKDQWHWHITRAGDNNWFYRNSTYWQRQQSPNLANLDQQSLSFTSRQRLTPDPVSLQLPLSLSWRQTQTFEGLDLGLGLEVVQQWHNDYQVNYFFHWQQSLSEREEYGWRGGIELKLSADQLNNIGFFSD